jgi:hypothetical protein
MKNYIKCLGIIALLAVIGLSFAACGGSEPEKTISITGIPAEYQAATSYTIFVDVNNKCVAMGSGQLSGTTVTCDLYTTKYNDDGSWNQTQDRWTGKGTSRVGLAATIGGNWKNIGNAEAISITGAVTTIPFSKFQVFN